MSSSSARPMWTTESSVNDALNNMREQVRHLEAMAKNNEVAQHCGDGFVQELETIHTSQAEKLNELIQAVQRAFLVEKERNVELSQRLRLLTNAHEDRSW